MARVNLDDVDKYNSNSSEWEWFKLADDGDIARVQFLYANRDEMEIYACHRVEVDGKERWVNCNRKNYDDPADDCPLCAKGMAVKPVLVLALYDCDTGKVKVWERGKTFIKKMEAIFNRFPDLTNKVFEIERQGKKGDKKTQYEVFPVDDEPVDISDIEKPQILGRVILDKSAEDMETYIQTGEFPQVESDDEKPVRRRNFDNEEAPVSRRSRRSV